MRRDQFYKSAWRPALTGAGLAEDRFVFHSPRHVAASSMLAEGVNPMAVAGNLGDTLETLQRVYAHWMRDDRDVPTEALERILADFSRSVGAAEAEELVFPSHRLRWWRVGVYAGHWPTSGLTRRNASGGARPGREQAARESRERRAPAIVRQAQPATQGTMRIAERDAAVVR